MQIYNFSSSSKGNATLLIINDYSILIDAGTQKGYLKQCLNQYGLTFETVDLVLVTHTHIDHIRSIKCFDLPIVYSLSSEHQSLNINKDNHFSNDIIVYPFILSHDRECLGYKIKYHEQVFTYISDTGYLKDEYIKLLQDTTYLMLEFNHDIIKLNNTNRPYFLKKRILSDKGHLNNQDAALFLAQSCTNLKQLVVAHISEEANSQAIILKTIQEVFSSLNKSITFTIKFAKYQEITTLGKCD
ncbi:MAG: MBL fold metallo-hydrolase [Bacilli bacterium]